MDGKNVEKKALTSFRPKTLFRRKWLMPFFLFFISLVFIPTHVFADDNLYSLSFDSSTIDITFGYLDKIKEIKFTDAYDRDLTNYNVDVYDCKGNKIVSGTTGTVPMNADLYPIKFKVTPSASSDTWRLDLAVQAIPSDDSSGSGKDYTDVLNNILAKLTKLEDFMDNPQYMQDGLNNLQGAVSQMNNYGPIATAQSAVGVLQGVNVDSGGQLPGITLHIFGRDINVFDLSAVMGVVPTIKALIRAVLWISLFIYIIRYFMPQLKI